MQRIRALIRRMLARRWLYLRAVACRALGRNEQAQALLKRVVMLSPSSFGAHRLLALLLLESGCEQEASQELGVCHRLDPARLHRIHLPERVRARVLDAARLIEEREVFELPPPESTPLPGEWDDLFAADVVLPLEPAPLRTDFVNLAEYRRFLALPAIEPSDIEGLDIDLLIIQLTQESQPGGTKD